MRWSIVVAALGLAACGDDGSAARPDAPIVVGGIAPDILPATFPMLTAGLPASPIQLAANGDTPTWAITAGAAPMGMSLSATGEYAGTPTEAGMFTFTITASNATGSDTLQAMQLVIELDADTIVLLPNNQIAFFPPGAPSRMHTPFTLTGVVAGETLVSIDRRPMNGQLYALGTQEGTSTSFSLYAIHPVSATAVPIATAQSFATTNADSVFGLDLTPAADRFRVVSGTGMNFRMDPNDGTVVDANGVVGDGNQRDSNINGAANAATETAYTNNKINNANITTQYTVQGGSLYQQTPPNSGTLTLRGTATGIESISGFDIPPGIDADIVNALVTSGSAYAVVKATGQTTQQGGTLDLVSGAFTASGTFPASGIRGLALPLGDPTIVALSSDATTLVRFQSTGPNSVGFVSLTGITAGETLVGIDFRPATGQLFALGIDETANTGTLYLVDPTTGALTAIAPSGIALVTSGAAVVDLPDPAAARYGVDFAPASDRVRVVTSTGLNFRIDPTTGLPVDTDGSGANGINPDPDLNGTVSSLDNVAYTNDHGQAATTGYGISGATDSLYLITDDTLGTVGTAITITNGGSALDFTSAAAFDIPQSVTATVSGTAVTAGKAYAALTVAGTTRLYRIDLVTGVSDEIGNIGAGSTPIIDIAVGQ